MSTLEGDSVDWAIGIFLHVSGRLLVRWVWVFLVIEHLWWVRLIIRILIIEGLLL